MNKDELKEILEPIKEVLKNSGVYVRCVKSALSVIEDIEKKYGLQPTYKTLREYIGENSNGAYHHFVFEMNFNRHKINADVVDISDFEAWFNGNLLDFFYVVEDKVEKIGDNYENYKEIHNLTLKYRYGE